MKKEYTNKLVSNGARNTVNRIIDANINRAKEGLRVCEEISRFLLQDPKLTTGLKTIRHKISGLIKSFPDSSELIKHRDSRKDIGKHIYINELKRKNIPDIFFANIQRAKESVRVLEEFLKLININAAIAFKEIRYDLYSLEKKISEKIKKS